MVAGQEGHRAKGCRTGGTQGKGMQDRRDTGQRDAGLEGFRTGGIHGRYLTLALILKA